MDWLPVYKFRLNALLVHFQSNIQGHETSISLTVSRLHAFHKPANIRFYRGSRIYQSILSFLNSFKTVASYLNVFVMMPPCRFLITVC